jgi:hypothetical protein
MTAFLEDAEQQQAVIKGVFDITLKCSESFLILC